MSKDIVIQKNGVPTNVTAEVIRTDGIEGGSVDWVPEDEVQLLEDKEITANGEYVAADEGYYGYKAVSVVGRNKGDIKLISKTIEANGTYRAESDGAYGYSRLSVRVKGGATYTDPDTGKKVTPDPSPDNGSTIVGLNSDGNEEAVKIINGQKKKLELASYIQADTLPSILEYHDGDRIFLTGLVAHGYKADGTPYKGTLEKSVLPLHQDDEEDPVYTDDFLPGGTVFNMPLYADISKGKEEKLDPAEIGIDDFNFSETSSAWVQSKQSQYAQRYVGFDYAFVGIRRNHAFLVVASKNGNNKYWGFGSTDDPDSIPTPNDASPSSYTLNGKTVYYRAVELSVINFSQANSNVEINSISVSNANKYAWYMAFGVSENKKQEITLTWPREGDRKHLQTTYEITVTE